jgi:hypothetical protein
LYRADVQYVAESRRLREEFFPERTATLISQLKKKGWYANVEAPAFMVNGNPVSEGDTILLTDELTLTGNYIMYTIDGSYPVEWNDNPVGNTTSDATLYSHENIAQLLSAGNVTLRAIAKEGSAWSATVTRHVFVIDEQTDFVSLPKAQHPTLTGQSIYDLNGRKVNSRLSAPDSQLKKGIYITNGKKVLR